MIRPGYYDVTVRGTQQRVGDDGNLGPETAWSETWLGARVLMLDYNGDAIVEHYPVGWRNVARRIDRVPASCIADGSYAFTPIAPVPDTCPST